MKATSPVMSQTQHPFGDPAATQYHQRDDLMRELMRRATNPQMQPVTVERDPLAPVSGEIDAARCSASGRAPMPRGLGISVPARHGWTIVAVVLLVAALAACTIAAL